MSRFLVIALAALGLMASSLAASAQQPPGVLEAVETFEWTSNMQPQGFSANWIPDPPEPGNNVFNSDLAFWGKNAIQGTYSGSVSSTSPPPSNPKEIINWDECVSPTSTAGNQGDVIVHGDLIFRAWNSPTPNPPGTSPSADPNAPRYTTPGAFCGD